MTISERQVRETIGASRIGSIRPRRIGLRAALGLCGVLFAASNGSAQSAQFRGIGDLPGGAAASTVRDATVTGGIIYAVGGGAALDQVLCVGPNNPVGCVNEFVPDTAVLWSWDGATATLTPLPDLATPANLATNIVGPVASAITRDAAFIASRARNNITNPGQTEAVLITRAGLGILGLTRPPFPASTLSGAVTISDDGSIVYGVSEGRARRFDVTTLSSIVIPLLPGHNNNGPEGRGASSDGSVMVGTSVPAPFDALQFRAFRYVHGSPAGTVSAIPLLAGGAWNRALAVSSDGNLTLVVGNSPSLPNGELYLHNATTGATTSLGTPNTPFMPGRAGGMTADGSVVAVTFGEVHPDGAPDSGYAYFHNAHGWFHLTSALAAHGIDIALQGWEPEAMVVSGISPDGTLVFGQGFHNGDAEGFVAQFPAGYLAGFDVPAVAPTDTSLVGAFRPVAAGGEDDTPSVLVTMADGTYYFIQESNPVPGFERGRYTWDPITGAFTITTLQDTNGGAGISGFNGISVLRAVPSADGFTLLFGDQPLATLSRIIGGPGSIVGGWVIGDPRIDASSAVFALLADGTFFFAEDGSSFESPGGQPGIETGTYTWVNDNFTPTINIDTNGDWGFSGDGDFTLRLSRDELRLTSDEPGDIIRVVDPRTVVPVITSPLARTATRGAPFAYMITASHGELFDAQGLPAGLAVNQASGLISGTPTAAGVFNVMLAATNTFNSTGNATLNLTIAVDTTGPTIAVTSPTEGASYTRGQIVAAAFSCTDPAGVASCAGSVANGASIDTALPGPHTFSVNAVDTVGNAATKSVHYTVTSSIPSTFAGGDFDGDGKADIAVYRGSTGQWFVRGIATVQWGVPSLSDIPVPADYDGDRRTDIAVYRPGTGTWYVRGIATVAWGQQSAGDVPVPADYNGDRIADIAVYRGTTGQWFIRGMGVVQWGDPSQGDVPVAADYDGDGKADIAVYRRSTGQWFALLSAGGVSVVSWGDPGQGDIPVVADYDGDHKADISVFRPTTGGWYIRQSGGGLQTPTWGQQSLGDVPVAADYNGDGKADVAVYRSTTGDWFLRNIAQIRWGEPSLGDVAAR